MSRRAILGLVLMSSCLAAHAQTSQPAPRGMTLMFHADPRFLEGLRRHDMLVDYGLRVHNTGFDTRTFGARWADSPLLQQARRSGRPYYIDRIAGGMPYQSLEGIEPIARELAMDPSFLGFQLHEWGNSPMHDHKRIDELITSRNLPFSAATFASLLEGRTKPPFLGGGDFSIYRELYRPLKTLPEVNAYLRGYMGAMVALTHGRLMAVNGYVQLYHVALEAGASNVMAEIGNQVPLTALQIACVRGAARAHGKPFGLYYEPWGGRPFGCPCATDFSPWFGDWPREEWKTFEPNIKKDFGSSRSLQRRLMYYGWLSGAAWWAEEWGAENCFENWQDYPLTRYGRILKEFVDFTRNCGPVEAIVPCAIVLPGGTGGVDLRYIGHRRDDFCELAGPDRLHQRLRDFADRLLAGNAGPWYEEANNLTASPWIGCFDVLPSTAPLELLSRYGLIIYLDEQQAAGSSVPQERVFVYTGGPEDFARCAERMAAAMPYLAIGKIGFTCARNGRTTLVGAFNNLGVSKKAEAEVIDARQAQTARIKTKGHPTRALLGAAFITGRNQDEVSLTIPPGELAVLAIEPP